MLGMLGTLIGTGAAGYARGKQAKREQDYARQQQALQVQLQQEAAARQQRQAGLQEQDYWRQRKLQDEELALGERPAGEVLGLPPDHPYYAIPYKAVKSRLAVDAGLAKDAALEAKNTPTPNPFAQVATGITSSAGPTTRIPVPSVMQEGADTPVPAVVLTETATPQTTWRDLLHLRTPGKTYDGKPIGNKVLSPDGPTALPPPPMPGQAAPPTAPPVAGMPLSTLTGGIPATPTTGTPAVPTGNGFTQQSAANYFLQLMRQPGIDAKTAIDIMQATPGFAKLFNDETPVPLVTSYDEKTQQPIIQLVPQFIADRVQTATTTMRGQKTPKQIPVPVWDDTTPRKVNGTNVYGFTRYETMLDNDPRVQSMLDSYEKAKPVKRTYTLNGKQVTTTAEGYKSLVEDRKLAQEDQKITISQQNANANSTRAARSGAPRGKAPKVQTFAQKQTEYRKLLGQAMEVVEDANGAKTRVWKKTATNYERNRLAQLERELGGLANPPDAKGTGIEGTAMEAAQSIYRAGGIGIGEAAYAMVQYYPFADIDNALIQVFGLEPAQAKAYRQAAYDIAAQTKGGRQVSNREVESLAQKYVGKVR